MKQHLSSSTKTVLELQQVSYKTLLFNISLTINAGSQVGIVGATGAGKTTLLRLLNRLIDPTAGEIYLDGKNIQSLPVQSLRRQVMLVPQEPSLLDMTVTEAIAYPLKLRGDSPIKIQSQLETWVERLQIERKLMQRHEVQLSLGQRQWVAIARALVTEPEILLLDEPTSALDTGKAYLLLEVLRELTQQGKTIIMVNHQLELIESWCDYLVQLHQGQVVRSESAKSFDWQALTHMLRAAITNSNDHDSWD